LLKTGVNDIREILGFFFAQDCVLPYKFYLKCGELWDLSVALQALSVSG